MLWTLKDTVLALANLGRGALGGGSSVDFVKVQGNCNWLQEVLHP
jgi:hypothetical protein